LERDTPAPRTVSVGPSDIAAEPVVSLQFIQGTVDVGGDTGPIGTLHRVLNGTSSCRTGCPFSHAFPSYALYRSLYWTPAGCGTVVGVGTAGVVGT
jgi:hypothetical protein